MIITEFYMTRPDGVRLERTYSDADVMIRNVLTGAEYESVINPENSGRQYEETDIPVGDEEVEDSEALRIITGGVGNDEG